MFYLN
jgi:hypothetical protein